VVQKAERFVAAAQLRLCSSLPKEVLGRLRIVVQIHTEVEVRHEYVRWWFPFTDEQP
jgi:hypothetical protein